MVAKTRADEEQSRCGGTWNTIDVGTKISKVCYVAELNRSVDAYLTGTWNEKENKIALWNVYYGKAKVGPGEYYKKGNEVVTHSSINDIYHENWTVVAGLEDGDIQVCTLDKGEHLKKAHLIRKVHGNAASTSVCILDGEILSGSDNGSIMRADLATTSKPSVLSMNLCSVKCMAVCGAYELVSGHGTGQIHLWDVRQINPAMAMGELPIYSKAVSPLTDAITSIDSHPAQPNIIGYGTYSGSAAFIDVRYFKHAPNLLKVAQEPITDLKFHPTFPTNCFVMSGESLLHMDLSMGKPEVVDTNAPIDDLAGKSRGNVWLTAASWNMLDINSLLVEGPKRLTSFDLSAHSVLAGSNTNSVSLLTNAQFF